MKLLISGATGLIGQALVKHLGNSHQFGFVGRDVEKINQLFSAVPHIAYDWDNLKANSDTILSEYPTIINLAGENIGTKRWSSKQKENILTSRVETTQWLATTCAKLAASHKLSWHLLNASAIGIYDDIKQTDWQNLPGFDEETSINPAPKQFLAQVGLAWENALSPAELAQIPVVKMRFGVVLSKQGGALKKLLPAFKLGLGAILGSGQQPLSWISIKDLVRAIDFLLHNPNITGPVNLVAPDVVSQQKFAQTLAHQLHRPCFVRMPDSVIKILLGEMGDALLLRGKKVCGTRLQSSGFQFQYPSLQTALADLL